MGEAGDGGNEVMLGSQAGSWAAAATAWAGWDAEDLGAEGSRQNADVQWLLSEFPGCRLRKIEISSLDISKHEIKGTSVERAGQNQEASDVGVSRRTEGAFDESTPTGQDIQRDTPDVRDPLMDAASAAIKLDLTVIEDVISAGPGGRIWDAAVVLSSYVLQRFGHSGMQDMAVIELGAGIGLVGIVCAQLGAEVSVTDKGFLLPLIDANLRYNAKDKVERGLLWGEELEWGRKLSKRMKRRKVDLIVASDVVGCGDQALFPPLIKSLVQLSDESSTFLMAYKPRAGFEREFFERASEHFHVKLLHRVELPKHTYSESYSAPIDLFEMKMVPANEGEELRSSSFTFDFAGYCFSDD